MRSTPEQISDWYQDEESWWNRHGEYMTYLWELTPSLNHVIWKDVESDRLNFLFHPGESLLDIGCGRGKIAVYFAERGMRVLGVDGSKEQVAAALAIRDEKSLNNLEFECANFIQWDAAKHEGTFDSVCVNAFLHHMPPGDLEIVFENIARVLKSNGRIYLFEPLQSPQKKSPIAKIIDRIIGLILMVFLERIPTRLKWFSDRHLEAVKGGFSFASPREAPIDMDRLEKIWGNSFEVVEIRAWHLHSLGFAMQTMCLIDSVREVYARWAKRLFLLDQYLLKFFSWANFSGPQRFILCSVKLRKK